MEHDHEPTFDTTPDHDDDAPYATPLESLGETPTTQSKARQINHAWRWGLRLASLVAVVALLGVTLASLAPHVTLPTLPGFATPTPNVRSLNISVNQANCATGYWSPDSRYIAVLSANPFCFGSGSGFTTQPDLYIYDAKTNAQIVSYAVGNAIYQAFVKRGEIPLSYGLTLDDLTWAPNQRTIAVRWQTYDASSPDSGELYGLVHIASIGSPSATVTVDLSMIDSYTMQANDTNAGATQPASTVAQVWDTRDGGSHALKISPASTYTWNADDTISPAASNSNASEAAHISPASTREFSVWETGTLSFAGPSYCPETMPTTPNPDIALLTLTIVQWSPDSRYLLTFTTQTRLSGVSYPGMSVALSSSLTTRCLTEAQIQALPTLPAQSPLLHASVRLLNVKSVSGVYLRWSPDGKRLLALPSVAGAPPAVALIYNATSGARLASIAAGNSQIPSAQGSDTQASITSGAWSPDSQRVLLGISGRYLTIEIYSGRALG